MYIRKPVKSIDTSTAVIDYYLLIQCSRMSGGHNIHVCVISSVDQEA